jgi:hypothetical protein
MIAHAATQVAVAADQLATGTLADLTRAMGALADGDLAAARARVTPPTSTSTPATRSGRWP